MITARDIMTRTFQTLSPDLSISEAVERFKIAGIEQNRRIFGMIVTDAEGRLLGMLSMYDILLFIRPKHIHVWGTMEDIDVTGLMEDVCARAKSIRVEDLMTEDMITITPETPLIAVLDIMITKHVRRLPVMSDDKVEGIVYISDLFYHLVDRLSP